MGSTRVRKQPARASSSWRPESWDAMTEVIGPYIGAIARRLGLSVSLVQKWRRRFGDELYDTGERNPLQRVFEIEDEALAQGRPEWHAMAMLRMHAQRHGYRLEPIDTSDPTGEPNVFRLLSTFDLASGRLSAVLAAAHEDGVYDDAERRLVREAFEGLQRTLEMWQREGAIAS